MCTPVPTAAFVVKFKMTVAMGENVWGLPALYVGNIAQNIIAPACICNGLQGVVTTSLAYVSNRPGVINFVVTFPAFVTALKYPLSCPTNTLVDVNVTWMKDAAPQFVDDLKALLEGDLLTNTEAYILGAMGSAPFLLQYSEPTYKV